MKPFEKNQSLCSRNCDDRLHFEVKKCVCSENSNHCQWVNKGRKCEAELTLGHKNQDLGHYNRNEMTYETENDGFGYESSRNWSNFFLQKRLHRCW